MQVKIKLLSDAARVPTYGSAGAACFDLYASDTVAITPGGTAVVKTGIAVEVPDGHVLMVYSRSGHGFKHGVTLINSVGVVDSDFKGEVVVGLRNDGDNMFFVSIGDRIAQAMIVPVDSVAFVESDDIGQSARGTSGFGSTGA